MGRYWTAGHRGVWSLRAVEIGLGVYTFGAAVYDSDGAVVCESRGTESVTIVAPISTYVVDSIADTIAEDGLVTLREAIEAINTGTAVGRRAGPDDQRGRSCSGYSV